MEPLVVLLSGGLNSTVAGSRMMSHVALHFLYLDYGQPAAESELRAAQLISEALAGELYVARLTYERGGAESAESAERAAEPSGTEVGMYRRPAGVMLAALGMAQQLAVRVKAEEIVCGASEACSNEDVEAGFGHAEADARHLFYHAGLIAIEMGTPGKRRINLDLPLMDFPRADIIRAGFRLGAPLHLAWSCHHSGAAPCGECQGCRSRAAAFEAVGKDDPQLASTL
jgi:7-cyano-7-deazaguanine synthase